MKKIKEKFKGLSFRKGYITGFDDAINKKVMGVSQWKNYGIKYKYDKYFKIKWPKQVRQSIILRVKLKRIFNINK